MKLLLTLAIFASAFGLAQPGPSVPRIQNAKLTERDVPSGLSAVFRPLAAQTGPLWIGYRIPHTPRAKGETSEWGCTLEGGNSILVRDQNTPVPLEGPSSLLILFRISEGKVERVRTLAPDCLVDAGGLPFYWLDHVNAAESVGLLEGLLKEVNHSGIIYAIATTNDPAAGAALRRLIEPTQPEAVRRSAVQWLAETTDGVPLAINLARKDKDPKIQRAAVNALAHSKDPRAVKFFEETLTK